MHFFNRCLAQLACYLRQTQDPGVAMPSAAFDQTTRFLRALPLTQYFIPPLTALVLVLLQHLW